MLENFKFKFYYNVNGSGRVAEGSNSDFDLVTTKENGHIKLVISPKSELELVHIEISDNFKFNDNSSVLVNGYQSWTLTKEWKKDEIQKGLRFPVKSFKLGRELASIYGDYNWKVYPETPGHFHGYTYGYVRNGKSYSFIGSIAERTGWTCINFDMAKNLIVIEKDVEGKKIQDDFIAFDLVLFDGAYDEVFDKYFDALNIKKCRGEHTCGYTSWYNYFVNINEEIILRDLEGLKRADNINIFQIDDGHQTFVGDWTVTDTTKFPHGMKYIVDKIHEKGFLAGLWMAPFYAQKESKVAAEHPDWIIRDEKGKPIKGFVGGRFCHTLNFYNKDCAKYIKSFFNTVLNEWGFDMVKLDFLCAICLTPFNNKTRGEIMDDAMAFLRECCGDKLMLGCGVPLAPAFGRADFCRIGSDVDINFKPRFLYSLTNNEVVSTQTSIQNAMFRRGLNGRAFGNDPDVFFMREINLKYTESEKRLVAEVNKTFGNLLFISDNVGDFSDKQLKFLNEIYTKSEKKIDYIDYLGNNTAKVYYEETGKSGTWTINWLSGENKYE